MFHYRSALALLLVLDRPSICPYSAIETTTATRIPRRVMNCGSFSAARNISENLAFASVIDQVFMTS